VSAETAVGSSLQCKVCRNGVSAQCRDLDIEDLHFHDLRHEGTSRLFEAGFSIEQASLVTGHKTGKCSAAALI
jgi:integrase